MMKNGNLRPPDTLLDERSTLLLRAISLTGPAAVDAFRRWRAQTILTDADFHAHRIVPLLVDLVRREGLSDADLDRMRGVGRHIWTQNTLHQRVVLAALDALALDGIQPMLLKGAALFARSPTFMAKRTSSDADMMVRPEELERTAAALRRAGFEPKGYHWDDFGSPLIDSDTPGVAMRLASQRGELDLHWRPLWNIRDPALTETVLARALRCDVNGRSVFVPSVTDQLFLALARCEPWDENESFTRLVEAQLLLSVHAHEVDWPDLLRLVNRYGLEATAYAFLGDLRRNAGLELPPDLLTSLQTELTIEKQAEWEIRRIPPERRSEAQRGTLQQMDQQFHRHEGHISLPTQREIQLRELGLNVATAEALWKALRDRMRPGPLRNIQFIEGFAYPEREGRWSTGKWSAIAVPLSPGQQSGEPVCLNAHAFLGRNGQARIVAHGGSEIAESVQVTSAAAADLKVRVRSLPELAGAGLIVLWLPDAQSPQGAGMSNDARELGLFIRRDWQLQPQAGKRPRGDQTLHGRLRDLYRSLPLPLAFRSRVAPILRRIENIVANRATPRPAAPASIEPGDIVLSAFLSDLSGIGRAGRLTRDSLATWDVPLVEHDLRKDPSAEDLPAEVGRGGIWVCHCNAPEAVAVLMAGTERLWVSRYRIGVWAYELQQLPSDWVAVLKHFHEIWAPSQFVADAILRSAAGPGGPAIKVVPHPLPPLNAEPRRPRSTDRPFTFLSMFDARSTSARKNPMGAVEAFKRAFEPNAGDVSLVVKVAYGDEDTVAMRDLEAAIAGWPTISLVTKHLSDTETLRLIADADCLVSLHRSEGFGLPIAEAMCVGTPAIITGWSAPVEFSKGAAIEIDYKLVPARDRSMRYERPGELWADADVDQAAEEMRKLAADPDRWAALSAAGLEIARSRLTQPIPIADYRRFLMIKEQAITVTTIAAE